MFWFYQLNFFRTIHINMPLKVKIIQIYIYYQIYKHRCDMALNFNAVFLLSVTIYMNRRITEVLI